MGAATMENSVGGPPEIRATLCPSNPTAGYLSEENERTNSEICAPLRRRQHSLQQRIRKRPACPPAGAWPKGCPAEGVPPRSVPQPEENVVVSSATTRTDLEGVTRGEVVQTGGHIPYLLTRGIQTHRSENATTEQAHGQESKAVAAAGVRWEGQQGKGDWVGTNSPRCHSSHRDVPSSPGTE